MEQFVRHIQQISDLFVLFDARALANITSLVIDHSGRATARAPPHVARRKVTLAVGECRTKRR